MIDPAYNAIMLSKEMKIFLHYEIFNSESNINILKAYISEAIENLTACNFTQSDYVFNLKVKKFKTDPTFYCATKFCSIYHRFFTDPYIKNIILTRAQSYQNKNHIIQMYNWLEAGNRSFISLMFNITVLPDKSVNIFI